MIREKNIQLTKFELEIISELWELGSASVREIQERLPEQKRPAYTTVQTMIYRMEEKGAVRRVKKIGNAHIFEPLVSRKSVHRKSINDLLGLFGGSARPLMAHLIQMGQLTLEDIRAMESELQRIENSESDNRKSKAWG
jgi:BlaI family transcriptional regulator, penicillinase repressor